MPIKVKNRYKWQKQSIDDIELQFDTLRLPAITCISCEQEFVLLSIGSEFASRIGINYHLLHCPFCGKPLSAKLLEMETENKKARFALPLGVLSRDGDIVSPDALNLSTFPSGIRDENGVMVGEITDVAIDGNKLIFTIEHCDEFVERLKKRGTWTITSAAKSSDC